MKVLQRVKGNSIGSGICTCMYCNNICKYSESNERESTSARGRRRGNRGRGWGRGAVQVLPKPLTRNGEIRLQISL